jgi:ABC-2 type transport system ATP-binding protein
MSNSDTPSNNHVPEAGIELVGLTKRYGRATVVDNLSLVIPRGTTFGLIGPNGAGKSTTIKMLMGMLSITAGKARVLGIDVAAEPARMKRRVGYVPETHHVYRWMRVGEVLRFVRSFYPTWNDMRAAELLKLFGLDLRKKVKHLSKGMVAKLSLLVAVAHDPDVLVLDEPMSGLDPIVREEFLDGVLQAICDRRCTVLFSSHTLDDVQRLADTVGILCQGRLLVHRGVDQLLAGTKRIRAVLRDGCLPAREPPGLVWQRVDRRQWLLTVSDFRPEVVERLRSENSLEHVEVDDLSLGELFKDYIKGCAS